MKALRPGDWLVLLLAGLAVAASYVGLWGGAPATEVRVWQNGQLYARWPLQKPGQLQVDGPLGVTRVEIAGGRARIAADPGPRQLCVRQGWLAQAGQSAVCLPNRVVLELAGAAPAYDSLNY